MAEDPFEAAVTAAMADGLAYKKQAREALWASPSRGQVAAVIRAQYDRAETAEAKLAAIAAEIVHIPGDGINFTSGERNRAEDILAIIGSKEGEDHG